MKIHYKIIKQFCRFLRGGGRGVPKSFSRKIPLKLVVYIYMHMNMLLDICNSYDIWGKAPSNLIILYGGSYQCGTMFCTHQTPGYGTERWNDQNQEFPQVIPYTWRDWCQIEKIQSMQLQVKVLCKASQMRPMFIAQHYSYLPAIQLKVAKL